jgi:hypothetical protein
MPSQQVFYFDYAKSDSTQIGSFETDQNIESFRYIKLYSDENLTNNVGSFVEHGIYTKIENNLETETYTLYRLHSIINLRNNRYMKIFGWDKYPGFENVTIDNFNGFVSSSNMGYINSIVKITAVGEIFKITIN